VHVTCESLQRSGDCDKRSVLKTINAREKFVPAILQGIGKIVSGTAGLTEARARAPLFSIRSERCVIHFEDGKPISVLPPTVTHPPIHPPNHPPNQPSTHTPCPHSHTPPISSHTHGPPTHLHPRHRHRPGFPPVHLRHVGDALLLTTVRSTNVKRSSPCTHAPCQSKSNPLSVSFNIGAAIPNHVAQRARRQ
jgi:hypothetical protein